MINNLKLVSGFSASTKDFDTMVEDMPIAVMTCRLDDFTIDYMNRATRENLKSIEHVLPVSAENLLGQSIDIFHKDPNHQRQLLSDHRNLPHTARIEVGGEWLDLEVSALFDSRGNYVQPMLTWKVITAEQQKEQEVARLFQMMDEMPINVMMLDVKDFTINYVNKTSATTLKSIEHLLPCRADDLLGQCFDIFHKDPGHQRRLVGDPSNLPYRTKIKLGEEHLDLNVSAIRDTKGEYIGPMLTWSVVTGQVKMADEFENNVVTVVEKVAGAADELQQSAGSMSASAEETNAQSSSVASASDQLRSSIEEISKQVSISANMAKSAVDEAARSTEMMNSLQSGAEKIGEVVNIIKEIAEQTNLLALNATIEAARAGEAGKGFAVVASEVKALATQTQNATGEIGSQVQEIRQETDAAVNAIGSISSMIDELSQVANSISAAVEEQTAATEEVSKNIIGVSEASGQSGRLCEDVRQTAMGLSEQSTELKERVADFLENVRKI